MYENVAAYDESGSLFPTKKSLKQALTTAPASVEFETTSPFTGFKRYTGLDIPEGITLSVVGPNPWHSRKWYASIKNVAGQVRIS